MDSIIKQRVSLSDSFHPWRIGICHSRSDCAKAGWYVPPLEYIVGRNTDTVLIQELELLHIATKLDDIIYSDGRFCGVK